MRIQDLPEGQVRPQDIRNLIRWTGKTEAEIREMDLDEVLAFLDAEHERNTGDIARIAGIPLERARDLTTGLGRLASRPQSVSGGGS